MIMIFRGIWNYSYTKNENKFFINIFLILHSFDFALFIFIRQIGVLAGGDVLCLLMFSAIGRFSHGLPFLDLETLKTADPFVAG